MSYIRCLSNPEGLYVFDSISGYVEFYWTDPSNPTAPNLVIYWKQEEFNAFFREYLLFEEYEGGVSVDAFFRHGNAELSEVWYHETAHRPMTADELEANNTYPQPVSSRIVICLRVGEQPPLYMWTTTWYYFLRNIRDTIETKRFWWLRYNLWRLRRWWYDRKKSKQALDNNSGLDKVRACKQNLSSRSTCSTFTSLRR